VTVEHHRPRNRGGCGPTGQWDGFAGFLFGRVAYPTFFGTILYAIGFVTGLVVPKAIDDGPIVPAIEALIVNLVLMSLFAVQHDGAQALQALVDAARAAFGRAQRLCPARKPRADPAVLAMAADAGGRLARWPIRPPPRR
jgi:hypothetical protein